MKQHRAKQQKTTQETTKYQKMDQIRLFTLEHELLKKSCLYENCIFSRNASRWRTVAKGATELCKVTYGPSRNMNADCFEDKGVIFSGSKEIYLKKGIEVKTPDMRCLQNLLFPIWCHNDIVHLEEISCSKFSLHALKFIVVSNHNRILSSRSILKFRCDQSKI
jgi:hypothetical protein